ncbi:hypothetical protein CHELA1G11_11948 [Hyphomicrobiales bacterium]|nr:hypothetical protein CHELA1G11_11948 [Hyphomicrobiales bacterium]CAH1664341.1 hypothetical protein CHELA1G2_12362 [Hyphomicrobiales bacterium]
MRHAHAVDYLKRGGSIYDLRSYPGHISVKSTEIDLVFLTAAQQSHTRGGVTKRGTERAACSVTFEKFVIVFKRGRGGRVV